MTDDPRTCPFDPLDPDLRTRSDEIYAELHERPDVTWSDAHGGFWLSTGIESCRAVARDWRNLSSADGVHVPPTALVERGVHIFSLEYDPPVHTRHRQILDAAVGRQTIARHEPTVRSIARDLLGRIDWSGEVDLAASFAVPYPLQVIFDIIGAEEEFQHEVDRLAQAIVLYRSDSDEADPAERVIEIARTIAERRRAEPRDDWLTELVQMAPGGEPLTVEEIYGAIIALIGGGHHSTSRGVSSLIARTLTEPGLWERVRAGEVRVDRLINETLRLHTPLPSFSRRATDEVEVDGIVVRPGQDVLMHYGAANRDPTVFDRPAEFDPDRDHLTQHLAFGSGLHRCVGIHLAQMELAIALEELQAAAPDLELVAPVEWAGPAEPAAIRVRRPGDDRRPS